MSFEIRLEQETLKSPESAIEFEWLDCNGLGGWSSSSVLGCNTRTYHGLLVAAVTPPTDRRVLLSRLDEYVERDGESLGLATRDFGDTFFPDGYSKLVSFSKQTCPTWEFRCGEDVLRKTLCCIQGTNSVAVRYQLFSKNEFITLALEPFLAYRDYHSLQHEGTNMSGEFEFSDSCLKLHPYPGWPSLHLIGPWSNFESSPVWHRRFLYRQEQKRGLGDREDLLCVGKLRFRISNNESVTILVSTDDLSKASPAKIFDNEIVRRQTSLLETSKRLTLPAMSPFLAQLLEASEQFLVDRGGGTTVIAGYHWFTDWGRDTLISLRGLCIATGKLDTAQQVLKVFCDHIRHGLVPNRFLEDGKAEFNTVDASLWMFVAAYDFFKAGGDKDFCKYVLLPALTTIFEAYCAGTHFDIREEDDGLIIAGNESTQLTWMDAKIGDWVVTPRHGKAVEINALWFNALNILQEFSEFFGSKQLATKLQDKIRQTQEAFNRVFSTPLLPYLYDVIRAGSADQSIRPNQIFAVGLPFSVLGTEKAQQVLNTVRNELLTPYGLRTLSPKDRHYRPKYDGVPVQRDSAYHQGTVWPWLLGSYIDALVAVEGEAGKSQAVECIRSLARHMHEAGIGSLSEIFDGDAPHHPRGTIAQAWSVAEVLRVTLKYRLAI